MKKQPTEWEKIFASYIFDKINNQIIQGVQKTNLSKNSLNKWANELNRLFLKLEVQMVNKHMKKFSASLAVKEMQIKTI
jgi:hypothetical protein